VLTHESRQVPAWLIFDVGQKMKPIGPFPEGMRQSLVEEPATPRRLSVVRFYVPAAWAFLWSPLLLIGMFYLGELSHRLLPVMKPLFAVVVFGYSVALMAAIVVLALSKRRSRWLFITLNAAVLLLEIVGSLFLVAGSSRIYQ